MEEVHTLLLHSRPHTLLANTHLVTGNAILNTRDIQSPLNSTASLWSLRLLSSKTLYGR